MPANKIILLVRMKAVLGTLSVQCARTAAPAELSYSEYSLVFCSSLSCMIYLSVTSSEPLAPLGIKRN